MMIAHFLFTTSVRSKDDELYHNDRPRLVEWENPSSSLVVGKPSPEWGSGSARDVRFTDWVTVNLEENKIFLSRAGK